MREIVVIEREVETPGDPDLMQRAEDAVAWCFEQRRVTFLYTLVAVDRYRAACVYEAPDVEAVRATQRTAGLPVTRAWRGTVTGEPASPGEGRRLVAALHAASSPLDARALAARLAGAAADLAARRVAPVLQLLASDGSRWLAAFAAPDPEAVAAACAALELPATVWPIELRAAGR